MTAMGWLTVSVNVVTCSDVWFNVSDMICLAADQNIDVPFFKNGPFEVPCHVISQGVIAVSQNG